MTIPRSRRILRGWTTLQKSPWRPSWPNSRGLWKSRNNEPHRVAFYLYELASEFHGLWNRGNDYTSLRFIQEGDIATSQAKIALARATGVVISNGLGILGVTPVEEMR